MSSRSDRSAGSSGAKWRTNPLRRRRRRRRRQVDRTPAGTWGSGPRARRPRNGWQPPASAASTAAMQRLCQLEPFVPDQYTPRCTRRRRPRATARPTALEEKPSRANWPSIPLHAAASPDQTAPMSLLFLPHRAKVTDGAPPAGRSAPEMPPQPLRPGTGCPRLANLQSNGAGVEGVGQGTAGRPAGRLGHAFAVRLLLRRLAAAALDDAVLDPVGGDDHVFAAAAVEAVDAGLAEQEVGAGVADQDVVVEGALDVLVGAGEVDFVAARDRVDPGPGRRRGRCRGCRGGPGSRRRRRRRGPGPPTKAPPAQPPPAASRSPPRPP